MDYSKVTTEVLQAREGVQLVKVNNYNGKTFYLVGTTTNIQSFNSLQDAVITFNMLVD